MKRGAINMSLPGIEMPEPKESAGGRKYPNVMWFPRSKTDLREWREVLKVAAQVQEASEDKIFTDISLGEAMARSGSINVVDAAGEEYIQKFKDEGTANKSYVTNARMLMRVFRFLGWVTIVPDRGYRLTDRGKLFQKFRGEFPATSDGLNEEELVLSSLQNFAFHSVNDTIKNRDKKFRHRPFVTLLRVLGIEPCSMYQLIVTALALREESEEAFAEIERKLSDLRKGRTTVSDLFRELGLDPDDYSCVHNFYDSAKILVYVGVKLGLIDKIKATTPELRNFGKQMIGDGKELKRVTVFYTLTDEGRDFLNKARSQRLIYYDNLPD